VEKKLSEVLPISEEKTFIVVENAEQNITQLNSNAIIVELKSQPRTGDGTMKNENQIEIVKRTSKPWGGEEKLVKRKKEGVKAFFLDSMGTDHFPVRQAIEMGFIVKNLPDYCSEEVSDFTITQLFMLKRQVAPEYPELMVGEPCLVIGAGGKIGSKVCEKMSGIGMNILPWDIKYGFEEANFLEYLSVAKVIVFCCDLNLSTKDYLKEKHFRVMKNRPFILNPVGRIGLVSLARLKKFLDLEGVSGYACDDPIRGSFGKDKRCFVSPHLAWKSVQSRNKRAYFKKKILKEIQRIL